MTYIMERRPSDFKKPKLALSGKPERKMPLSTMAKLSGGISNSSPSFSESSEVNGVFVAAGGWEEAVIDDGEDSIITVHISPLKLSTFMKLAPKNLKGESVFVKGIRGSLYKTDSGESKRDMDLSFSNSLFPQWKEERIKETIYIYICEVELWSGC